MTPIKHDPERMQTSGSWPYETQRYICFLQCKFPASSGKEKVQALKHPLSAGSDGSSYLVAALCCLGISPSIYHLPSWPTLFCFDFLLGPRHLRNLGSTVPSGSGSPWRHLSEDAEIPQWLGKIQFKGKQHSWCSSGSFMLCLRYVWVLSCSGSNWRIHV